jgi:hypothetical protein
MKVHMSGKRMGRPPVANPKSERFELVLTPAEKERILSKGGAEYVRTLVKKDKEEESSLSGQA